MLSIMVLEDNPIERKLITQMINNRIKINKTPKEYDAQIVLMTDKPQEIIDKVEANSNDFMLAFLDIDLQTEIDGIEVAARIKSINPYAQVVFVTADADALKYTIQQHVAPLDYITKDGDIEHAQDRLFAVLDTAYERYESLINKNTSDIKYFAYSKANGIFERIPMDQVYYLELQPQKYKRIRVFADNKIFDCSGALKDFAAQYENLVFANRDTLINLNTISKFDMASGMVYFGPNQEVSHGVSVRRRYTIKKMLNN